MKDYNLSSLEALDDQYKSLADSLLESYKGSWDDTVHDSYMVYVRQVKEMTIKMHEIRCAAIALDRALEALNVERLEQEAMRLRQEGDCV